MASTVSRRHSRSIQPNASLEDDASRHDAGVAQNPTYAGAEPASHGPALTNLNYESVEPTSRGLAAQNPTYAGADPAYEEATTRKKRRAYNNFDFSSDTFDDDDVEGAYDQPLAGDAGGSSVAMRSDGAYDQPLAGDAGGSSASVPPDGAYDQQLAGDGQSRPGAVTNGTYLALNQAKPVGVLRVRG